MRVCQKNQFSDLCFVLGEWHSKTKLSIDGLGCTPSPQPSPKRERELERQDKN
jgi:hypothetical protein